MSGVQQYSNEVYDRIVEMYQDGKQLAEIQNSLKVARNTVYTALRVRGVQQRKAGRPKSETPPRAPALAPSRRGALHPDSAYGRVSEVLESPCQCCTNCGFSFR